MAPKWILIWNDEFDGDEVDLAKWNILDCPNGINIDIAYMAPHNVWVDDGCLVLREHKEKYKDYRYPVDSAISGNWPNLPDETTLFPSFYLIDVVLNISNRYDHYSPGYEVFVSRDDESWGVPVASGAGNPTVTTITFDSQIARFFKLVQTNEANDPRSITDLRVNMDLEA